jgi:hypothetical protein
MSSEKNLVLNDPFSSAGIMVSQTVSVNVVEPTTATEMKDNTHKTACFEVSLAVGQFF